MLWALSPAFAQTIYDINFSTPDQGVNQVVVTRDDWNYVSEIVFGAPEVVSAFGGLTDQPLRFDTVNMPPGDPYDQIKLYMRPYLSSTRDLSFDFTSVNLIGSINNFTLLIDTPTYTTRYIKFRNDGQIVQSYFGEEPIGSFTDGETFRFGIHIDYDADQWWFCKNGVLLGESVFDPPATVGDFRFSYGPTPGSLTPDSSGVAIDNLIVEVPEPTRLCYLTMWLMILAGLRRFGAGSQNRVGRKGKMRADTGRIRVPPCLSDKR